MRGNVTKRGKGSWRLKFDLGTDPVTGKRLTQYVTVRGTKKVAEAELSRRLNQVNAGGYVPDSKKTVGEHVRKWLEGNLDLAPTTKERFSRLIEKQIVPHLGNTLLQRLRPSQITEWHSTLRTKGGKDERPLSPATVRQAHRVLHLALGQAFEHEEITRNVASGRKLPKSKDPDIQILKEGQISPVLNALTGHWLMPIATVAVGTGMRQGEIMALQWGDVDLNKRMLNVRRNLEETKAHGLRFKVPKTKNGIRTISLPGSVIEVLIQHRKQQLEQRLALGLGKPSVDTLVFGEADGGPIAPSRVSGAWRDTVKRLKLIKVRFHDLRHTHASALIASKLDVVAISRRLGHASPVVTLSIYAHLFKQTDDGAAAAIEDAMRTGAER